MRIAYIANKFPFGESETFIWPEVDAHRRAGLELVLCPLTHAQALHAYPGIDAIPILHTHLLAPRVLWSALLLLLTNPAKFLSVFQLIFKGPLRVIVRNAAVLPKGIWLAKALKYRNIDHIHAHWLSTPATAAMIASRVSGIPYSVTAHRIDISQGNLIPEKLATAKFVRAIDIAGRDEIISHSPHLADRVVLIHLGTSSERAESAQRTGPLKSLRIATAARLVEKKGHAYLIHAIALAKSSGVSISADFFGDGPLRSKLELLADYHNVGSQVRFLGSTPHERILEALESGRYDAAVLPSITAISGDREGIPAFLMEAMAVGLPTVSTLNGGIGELISDDCGWLVDECDAIGLADALVSLAASGELRSTKGRLARCRIIREFSVDALASRLRAAIFDLRPS